jgi:hypothetical protein
MSGLSYRRTRLAAGDRRLRLVLPLAAGIVSGAGGGVAHALQPGMGPTGPGTAGPGPGERKEKKEGPAEEAPKDKEALQPIVPVPAQPERQRRIQLFELHGYLRMRGDYFHRLDLAISQPNTEDDPQTNNKFFRPPAQTVEVDSAGGLALNDATCIQRLTTRGVNPDKASRRCERRNGFASANMRLRLEPTLHVTDTIRVHAQVDALDNVVLGSTPDTLGWDNPYAPINLYTRTQTAPTAGTNSFTDSILVKRAWGQIRFGWGLDLRFGRMPHHWGLGIVANDGNGYYRGAKDDIVHMLDMDYGDSVDSVRFAFDLGKDRRRTHTLAASWDWAASGPTTAQLLGPEWDSGGRVGQTFSAEKFDNVYQWSLSAERRDQPEMLRRKLALGSVVLNYGLMNWLRYQDVDRAIGSPGLGDGLGTNPTYENDAFQPDDDDGHTEGGGEPLGNGDLDADGRTGLQRYANLLVHRRALLYTPDLWFRINWRTLRIELEAAAQFGRFYHRDLAEDISTDTVDALEAIGADDMQRSNIQSVGYALEFKYGFFQDRFHIGLNQGFALGDATPSQEQNPQNPLLAADGEDSGNDGNVRNFRFNPAYVQDLLLFRELLGTVSNAAYFKGWAAFYFIDANFSARLDIEYALAQKKQSTYGDKRSWGLELDAALRYHDREDPIFFQLQYGVMFPFGAFNRPSDLYGANVPNNGDAKAAQTLQGQVGIRF